MSNAKIRLKVGSMELDYEGDPAFLTGGIEALLETMGALASKVPDDALMQAHAPVVNGNGTVAPASGGSSDFSTNTIAANIDAKLVQNLWFVQWLNWNWSKASLLRQGLKF